MSSVFQRISEAINRFGSRRIFANPSHGPKITDGNILRKLANTPLPQGWKAAESPNTWYLVTKDVRALRGCTQTISSNNPKAATTVAHCVNSSFTVTELEKADFGRLVSIDSPVQVVDEKYYRILESEAKPITGERCISIANHGPGSRLYNQKDSFTAIVNTTQAMHYKAGSELTTLNSSLEGGYRFTIFNTEAANGTSGTEFKCEDSGAHTVLSTSQENNKRRGTISY